jgi:hypothetical protein
MLPILFTIVIQRSFDMNKTMKKVAIAAAVAGALGGISGAAQAITLSKIANGVVVPYVLWDTAAGIDTAIGVTTAGANIAAAAASTNTMHVYFYNVRSQHEFDFQVPMTSNDFYGFNWSQKASLQKFGTTTGALLDGMKGYMVMKLEGSATVGNSSMFGDAAMITGNWTSAAFIPVVSAPYAINAWPTDPDGYPAADNIPNAAQVVKVASGVNVNDISTYHLDLRYYAGPALGQRTDFVVWVDRNHQASAADANYIVAAEVFDENENSVSTGMVINNELNVWESTKIGGVANYLSGFVALRFPIDNVVSYHQLGNSVETAADTPVDSVVAFSLIYTSSTGIQTALAHERF